MSNQIRGVEDLRFGGRRASGCSGPLIYTDPVSAGTKTLTENGAFARRAPAEPASQRWSCELDSSRWPLSSFRFSVGAAGCGKYSISNIRSLKAFQDANALYKKGEYSRAALRYTDAVTLNPDLGFAYFFLGNSYDNLYKPGRRGEAENDANLPKAAENYRHRRREALRAPPIRKSRRFASSPSST